MKGAGALATRCPSTRTATPATPCATLDAVSLPGILRIVSRPDGDERALKAWYDQTSLLQLLADQRTGPTTLLYASGFGGGSLFMRAILVPLAELAVVDAHDLAGWSTSPHDSWSCGLVWGAGGARVEFDAPLRHMSAKALRKGEQLVFSRDFDGRRQDRHYYELAQTLTHAHDLHWTPERRAWCRFDENGDVETVAEWSSDGDRATCITIRRDVMEMQMSAREMAVVQMFDSTLIPDNFGGWGKHEHGIVSDERTGLYYRTGRLPTGGSYFRGVQIIRPQRSAKELGEYLRAQETKPKRYESFITQDWKNDRVAVVSCDPAHIASYFEKDSPLPFHISPVFFNPRVLDKYRADPEKYSLDHRSITCRHAWHLQTYDVNEAGQVHTYIKYLGDLPHTEQVYWKSFNEEPGGPISRRSYVTDFEGRFDEEPDSLRDLHNLLGELHKEKPPWFRLREPDLVNQLHYPLTESVKTWGEAIATLAKLVNEGLERKFFQRGAQKHGARGDTQWGSILWAREYLRVTGADQDLIDEVVTPLRDLQYQRQQFGAHSAGEEAAQLREDLLRQHKTPRGHVAHLAGRLVYSLRMLRDLSKAG
jgi:hypothetical protein